MASEQAVINAIQVLADASNEPLLRIAFGAPGAHVSDATGAMQPTGQAWEPEPTPWTTVIGGVAAYLDAIRTVVASGDLLSSDRIVEIAASGVTVTLPPPAAAYRNRYVIKALNYAGVQVAGVIDGAAGPHALAAYGVLRVYCNGTAWLTW